MEAGTGRTPASAVATPPAFGWFPSRVFAINQAWPQLALTGIDCLPEPKPCY